MFHGIIDRGRTARVPTDRGPRCLHTKTQLTRILGGALKSFTRMYITILITATTKVAKIYQVVTEAVRWDKSLSHDISLGGGLRKEEEGEEEEGVEYFSENRKIIFLSPLPFETGSSAALGGVSSTPGPLGPRLAACQTSVLPTEPHPQMPMTPYNGNCEKSQKK